MLEFEITSHYNDDIMFPAMVYEVYLVHLHRQPIKSKTMEYEDYLMEEYAISKEEWAEMSDREKLMCEYNIEVGNKVRSSMYDAINFIDKVDENIIPKDEKKKILNKMEKAMMTFEYPFSLNLDVKV